MFETHKLSSNGFDEVADFKTIMANAVKQVDNLLPDGRERNIFKTKMEEAMFFGTKAIASKPGNYTEITTY